VFSFDDALRAFRYYETGKAFGKITLLPENAAALVGYAQLRASERPSSVAQSSCD
jgi:hypothetical protein